MIYNMVKYKLSSEKVKKIVELSKKGYSIRQIAREVKVSIPTVYKYRKLFNIS